MNKELIAIFDYLEKEKGIPRKEVVASIEEAIVMSAKKSTQEIHDLHVNINSKTGELSASCEKEVVEKVNYPSEEISLEVALEIEPECHIGDFISIEIDPKELGRIAAKVAKQVITQKLRGAEKQVIYTEYKDKIGDLITGTIKKILKGGVLIVDLGKIDAILPGRNYPKGEKYNIDEQIIALLLEVQDTEEDGASIILSRSDPRFVELLFQQEIPEIHEGIITIEKIVREPGLRTKMAVSSNSKQLDPVGACVGMKGSRIKNVIRELNNEKIDIIPYDPNPLTLFDHAISPVHPIKTNHDEKNNSLHVVVSDADYPTVIGKFGNNARLLSEITGLEIKIQKQKEYYQEILFMRKELASRDDPELDEKISSIPGINPLVLDHIKASGLDTLRKILVTSTTDLAKLAEISLTMADDILETIRKTRTNSE